MSYHIKSKSKRMASNNAVIKVCVKYTSPDTYIYYQFEKEKFFQLLRISCCYFISDDDTDLWHLLDEVGGVNDFRHRFFDLDDIDFILYRIVNVLVTEEQFIDLCDDDVEYLEVYRS